MFGRGVQTSKRSRFRVVHSQCGAIPRGSLEIRRESVPSGGPGSAHGAASCTRCTGGSVRDPDPADHVSPSGPRVDSTARVCRGKSRLSLDNITESHTFVRWNPTTGQGKPPTRRPSGQALRVAPGWAVVSMTTTGTCIRILGSDQRTRHQAGPSEQNLQKEANFRMT